MMDGRQIPYRALTGVPTALLLAGVILLVAAVWLLVPPIAQDPAYHDFTDRRRFLGIPNFWNVVTNLPFILVGAAGVYLLSRGGVRGGLPELRPSAMAFFAGVALTGFGSGYYHLEPTNTTLVWDRLPMAISFMAFFSIILGEHLSVQAGRRLLWPLVIAGIASVLYWHLTEQQGRGDLRPYALVQFLPFLLIPLVMLIFRSRLTGTGYLWGVIAAYLASKLAEFLDAEIYTWTGMISGHSLKHLLAAAGAWLFYRALQRREVLADRSTGGT